MSDEVVVIGVHATRDPAEGEETAENDRGQVEDGVYPIQRMTDAESVDAEGFSKMEEDAVYLDDQRDDRVSDAMELDQVVNEDPKNLTNIIITSKSPLLCNRLFARRILSLPSIRCYTIIR